MIESKTYMKSIQGARNRSAGALFEELIESSLYIHRSRGEAVITKTPEPIRIISRPDSKGYFKACFRKKGEADDKGVVSGGRGIVLEAKSTATGKLPAGTVKGHQRDFLDASLACGALVYILAWFGGPDTYRISWPLWRNMREHFGHSYVTQEDVQPFRLPRMNGLCPDILYGIRNGRKS